MDDTGARGGVGKEDLFASPTRLGLKSKQLRPRAFYAFKMERHEGHMIFYEV